MIIHGIYKKSKKNLQKSKIFRYFTPSSPIEISEGGIITKFKKFITTLWAKLKAMLAALKSGTKSAPQIIVANNDQTVIQIYYNDVNARKDGA